MNHDSDEEKGLDTLRKSWFSGRERPKTGEVANAYQAPPPPKKRRSGLIGIFSGLMTIFVLLICGGGAAIVIALREMATPGPSLSEKLVYIERGSSTEDVLDQLTREGVIENVSLFWGAVLLREVQSKFTTDKAHDQRIKAGEYLIKRQASMSEVLDTLASGRSVEHAITLPEGLTSEQIVERLNDNPLLSGGMNQIPPEGSLLPETYKVHRGTSRQALISRMQNEQKRALDEIWSRRAQDTPIKNQRELVTLASIVEKETGRADERSRVAGVFINRLIRGIKLQSDPTIVYGIVGGKGTLGRPISRADIDRPTAFNTYSIPGLPPGPIANPGRAAMEAVANPSRTKDLFFVADGSGGHAFAETLEQHNRNVARWRQLEAASTSEATTPATSKKQ